MFNSQGITKAIYTEVQYALLLSLKLGSIGLYLGWKIFLCKVISRFETYFVSRLYCNMCIDRVLTQLSLFQ